MVNIMKVNLSRYRKNTDRKIDVEIQPFDTWSLDHTLASIIFPALCQLKETKHGIPSEFAYAGGEDYIDQDSFDFYKETHNEAFEECCKRWDEVLDKMIWSFYQIAFVDYEELYHHGKIKTDWIKTDITYKNPITGNVEPTYQLIDKNPEEHWYDHDGHQLHEERIQEGLELFGKYFRSLWD